MRVSLTPIEIFLRDSINTPIKVPKKTEGKMKEFVGSLIQSNFGFDAKTVSMFDCFEEKLFQYYERDLSQDKKQGIQDMTDRTIELLHKIDDIIYYQRYMKSISSRYN